MKTYFKEINIYIVKLKNCQKYIWESHILQVMYLLRSFFNIILEYSIFSFIFLQYIFNQNIVIGIFSLHLYLILFYTIIYSIFNHKKIRLLFHVVQIFYFITVLNTLSLRYYITRFVSIII